MTPQATFAYMRDLLDDGHGDDALALAAISIAESLHAIVATLTAELAPLPPVHGKAKPS